MTAFSSAVLAVSSGFALLVAGTFALGADFTVTELEALSADPALKHIDLPFLEAPRPSASRFVAMDDGVRLAVSLYFPDGFDPAAETAPAVFEDSIYGRAEDAGTTAISTYLAAGYVVVIGDARGFAASFGSQNGFNTKRQTEDEAAMIAWIAAQGWSNGQVAAIGHSVSAVFADSVTASGAPALKAAIIRASDFDEYSLNMFPGGAPNLSILSLASELMAWHAGADCADNLATCAQLGFMPVEGDEDFTLLQAAIREHGGNLPADAFAGLVYRDDVLGEAALGGSAGMDRVAAISDAAVPARVSASWMDGMTALSALTRFEMAAGVPMEVVIGATSHPGGIDADPFATTPFGPARPGATEQFSGDVGFIDRVLSGEPIGRSISYVVLGTDVWKTTEVWPPAGVEPSTLMLAPARLLTHPAELGEESVAVDPTATSGAFNRWAAQRGTPVFYGDRADVGGKRPSFDGEPLTEDMELVGSPELCILMSTDMTDGLVIAYLEDVAPDGRVTYLTEGILRLLHRTTEGEPCDPAPGTLRSYERADGARVVPGEMMRIEISLLPVAARIAAGHHLRLSLAGADAGWFSTLTGDVPATWTLAYGGTEGSSLLLPMRPWSEN